MYLHTYLPHLAIYKTNYVGLPSAFFPSPYQISTFPMFYKLAILVIQEYTFPHGAQYANGCMVPIHY